MIDFLAAYDRMLVERLLLFFVLWFALIANEATEGRYPKCSGWQGAIPPVNGPLSWVAYGFGAAAIAYLLWSGLEGISMAYLIATPGFIVVAYLVWRRGEHILDALPIELTERKRIKFRIYAYAALGFLVCLGFLFAVDWLGF